MDRDTHDRPEAAETQPVHEHGALGSKRSRLFRGGITVLVALLFSLGAAQAEETSDGNGTAAARSEAREIVTFLAGPDSAGRDALTGDATLAAGYVLAQVRGAGLLPDGDDGTYVQRFNLVEDRPDVAEAQLAAGEQAGVHGTDYTFN